MGESVIRVRPLGKDKYGDAVAGTPARKTIPGCLVAAGTSAETVAVGRDTVVSDFVVYAPAGTDVRPTDQLVIRGDTCEVVGRPFAWVGMSGWRPGVEIHANRAEG